MALKLKNKVGLIGEETAVAFLMKQGFSIRERNYLKKWGEIDIIAQKEGKLHFVEVKTVSRENMEDSLVNTEKYSPEDNIHPKKLQRIQRTITSYMLEQGKEGEEYQIDAVIVFINQLSKQAKIRMIENIVL